MGAIGCEAKRRLFDYARHTPVCARSEVLAWLRRWRHRPDRVFCEIDPATGE